MSSYTAAAAAGATQAPEPVDTDTHYRASIWNHEGAYKIHIAGDRFFKTAPIRMVQAAARLITIPEPSGDDLPMPKWATIAEHTFLDHPMIPPNVGLWADLHGVKFDAAELRRSEADFTDGERFWRKHAPGHDWPRTREVLSRLEPEDRETMRLKLLAFASAARARLDTHKGRIWIPDGPIRMPGLTPQAPL